MDFEISPLNGIGWASRGSVCAYFHRTHFGTEGKPFRGVPLAHTYANLCEAFCIWHVPSEQSVKQTFHWSGVISGTANAEKLWKWVPELNEYRKTDISAYVMCFISTALRENLKDAIDQGIILDIYWKIQFPSRGNLLPNSYLNKCC